MFDEGTGGWEPLGRQLEMLRRMWAVDHASQQLSRAMATKLGVTGPQRLVLRVVGKRPGISAGELAGFLHLDASTMTGHLRRLEDLGLIERRNAVEDARRTAISLTARGRRLDVRTPGTVEAAMESVLAEMDAQAAALVESFLRRFERALDAQTTSCREAPKVALRRAPTRARP